MKEFLCHVIQRIEIHHKLVNYQIVTTTSLPSTETTEIINDEKFLYSTSLISLDFRRRRGS